MEDIGGGTNEGPKATQTKRETDERREKKRLAKWDWRRSGRVILGGQKRRKWLGKRVAPRSQFRLSSV